MKISQLHQVVAHADDMDQSVAFYRDLLGIRLIARFDPPGLAFFDLDGVRLLLERGAPKALLYLRVDDIEAAHADLVQRGVEFSQAPAPIHRDDAGDFGAPGEVEWMAFFTDPGGNTVALASRRPGG